MPKGHQVNFYLDADDTRQVETIARSIGPVVLIHDRSCQPLPRVLDSLFHFDGEQQLFFYYLVQPEFLDAVLMQHVPAQGYWTVDDLRSPVIELSTCFCDGVILRRGRLYYVDGFYDSEDNWVYHSDSFRKWAKTLLAKTRRTLTRLDTVAYIGQGAKAWLETSGGKLSVM